jgi:hypothetical protein
MQVRHGWHAVQSLDKVWSAVGARTHFSTPTQASYRAQAVNHAGCHITAPVRYRHRPLQRFTQFSSNQVAIIFLTHLSEPEQLGWVFDRCCFLRSKQPTGFNVRGAGTIRRFKGGVRPPCATGPQALELTISLRLHQSQLVMRRALPKLARICSVRSRRQPARQACI